MITVSTANYRRSHGQNPPANQHGNWWYVVDGKQAVVYNGTYTQATQQAKAQAKHTVAVQA